MWVRHRGGLTTSNSHRRPRHHCCIEDVVARDLSATEAEVTLQDDPCAREQQPPIRRPRPRALPVREVPTGERRGDLRVHLDNSHPSVVEPAVDFQDLGARANA